MHSLSFKNLHQIYQEIEQYLFFNFWVKYGEELGSLGFELHLGQSKFGSLVTFKL